MTLLRRFVEATVSGRLMQIAARRSLRALGRAGLAPFDLLVDTGSLERPAHAYCLWHAADLARRLGYREISAAEFGVAGGVTFLILQRYAEAIEKATGVRIQLYGFDTGEGLPRIDGAADLPYWFQPSQYHMNVEALRRQLTTRSELVLGNVAETVPAFFSNAKRPPLAAIFNDLDLFSSSRDALKILDAEAINFLPRMFLYLDDVGGSALEMYGPFNGELAANDAFNAAHDKIKIHLNQNLLGQSHLHWRYQIYYAHLFDHPRYSDYIGDGAQQTIETALRLAR